MNAFEIYEKPFEFNQTRKALWSLRRISGLSPATNECANGIQPWQPTAPPSTRLAKLAAMLRLLQNTHVRNAITQ